MLLAVPLPGLLAGLQLAPAAQAAEPVPLKLGIFPRRDAVQSMRLFKPLAAYLQEQLGRPVELEASASFEDFEQRLAERRYDLVHLNQYHYVKSHQAQRYEALVQNEEFGEASIRGAIYVRKDSGISSLQQLKGKSIIFGGGPQAMMAYIVPSYLLRQGGLQAGDYQAQFASSPPNAVLATYLGQADAGGAGEVVMRLPLVTSKVDVTELSLLAVSEPLPHLPWAVKAEMPAALQEQLRELLLGLKQTEAGRGILKKARLSGLNPVTDADYDAHRQIIQQLEVTD
ncbi:MAG: phosphate/phosphite/phosphonate ABC transporter substrate-binding protein [Gammaproteobacteria bacterium]|nr:phosphate/phosphite/phosphonate ABC transporter substrate-binding protein [Gammaproteobacteria bacterium]